MGGPTPNHETDYTHSTALVSRAHMGLGLIALEGIGTVAALMVEGTHNASVLELGITLGTGLVTMVASGIKVARSNPPM